MSIAEELRTAGLTVVEGRQGIGRTEGVTEVVVSLTQTDAGAADDVNLVAAPARGVAYVERSGRVWLLADGPVVAGPATVWVAGLSGAALPAAQEDAVAVVTAVLAATYRLDAADPVADEPEADPEPEPEPAKPRKRAAKPDPMEEDE